MKRLILASSSPRRKELLEQANLTFSIKTSSIEEVVDPSFSPAEVVQSLALQKAKAVAGSFTDDVVLGADTIVVLDNEILGKPKDKDDAIRMLKMLSGQTHFVYTGVAMVVNDNIRTFTVETRVTFWDLTEDEITFYTNSPQPYDKAGSYGIQDFGATFVKEIEGDYFAVVGLPIARTVRELKQFGIYPSVL